jgi:hypothetical protein
MNNYTGRKAKGCEDYYMRIVPNLKFNPKTQSFGWTVQAFDPKCLPYITCSVTYDTEEMAKLHLDNFCESNAA